ncbi:hypothetical protein PCA10_38250 [Metapseudomonas resinovorans NBRC 106553]|uniref:Uncharacterized protein n=1 Tax=Metapseudomonas resinovorans NBRC 106553 TaxID=1245471 RepID=S6AGS1_METRE|nr:hypothetical protein PCA10_38250 [Pseudomonas resinovorans NBRC 106553]
MGYGLKSKKFWFNKSITTRRGGNPVLRAFAQLLSERAAGFCFAFPGDSLWQSTECRPPQRKQRACPDIRPGCAGFPRYIVAPGARREGPSMAPHASRGIHAAHPPTQRFRSAS